MKRLFALMLALAMIFAFAACKNDTGKDDDSTTAAGADASAGDETAAPADGSTAPVTDDTGSTVPATGDEASTAAGPQNADETKGGSTGGQTAAVINAPVNGSKADIVNFFNKYATAMKQYTGKVTVKRVQGTTSKINSITGGDAVKDKAEPLLPNDYPQTSTKTFNGGKASDGTTLAKFLPADDLKAYNVPAEGVKSATCVKQGSGWKVSITLVPESGTGLQYVPKYHSKCFDTLTLTEDDFSPFKPKSTTVNYQSGTYTFVLGADGRITSISVSEPANVVCTLTIGGSNSGIDADFTGTWRQDYTFTY